MIEIAPGPRHSRLVVAATDDIPLVWFQFAFATGSASDPADREGLSYHAAVLARRGAGARDRLALDGELDALGASLGVAIDRDAIRYSGLCLARNLDRVFELATDVLIRPRFDAVEHGRLVRESQMTLDELRDDDHQLAARFFNRHCVPSHPYARTIMGTERSLATLEIDQARARQRDLLDPAKLVVGFAGAIEPERARAMTESLVGQLPETKPETKPETEPDIAPGGAGQFQCPALDGYSQPAGRRVVVVDKPERAQSQILLGHLGPRYGTREALAMIAIETAFGGTFTARLMQEIRVKRGWSYDAGCTLQRSRGPHWFRIHLAPAAEVTPDALALTWSLYGDLAEHGLSADELAFARTYLTGSLPFRLATARQKVRAAIQNQLFDLPSDYLERVPQELAALTLDETNHIARTKLWPDDSLAVVVATADTMVPRLEALGYEHLTVLPYDRD